VPLSVVLDTNVFVAGIFWSGPPHTILRAWGEGRIRLAASAEILDEYARVASELSGQYLGVDIAPIVRLVTTQAQVVSAPPFASPVCADPDDDKFLACAFAARVPFVVTGDKHLLAVTAFPSLKILRPRQFVDRHLPVC
jgi:uncharacterized protein